LTFGISEVDVVNYPNSDSLAKNWILQAGTSQAAGAGINLRSGIGDNGSYGMPNRDELGYRPMPGLTSVSVDSAGVLGSLRQATINFKVWDINQLSIIEALYFRLGFSMLLEWGHVQYFSNRKGVDGTPGTFIREYVYGIDPFKDTRKEFVQQELNKHARESSGNYEGMLGVVTNFNWSFNQEGGYDCTVKLSGLGAIIDTLRINQSYTMPATLYQTYLDQKTLLKDEQEKAEIQAAQDKEARERKEKGLPDLPPAAKDGAGVYNIYKTDIAPTEPISQDQFLQEHSYYPAYLVSDTATNTVPDYYYRAVSTNQQYRDDLNIKRAGLYLNSAAGYRATFDFIPADVSEINQSVTLRTQFIDDILAKKVTDDSYQLLEANEGVKNIIESDVQNPDPRSFSNAPVRRLSAITPGSKHEITKYLEKLLLGYNSKLSDPFKASNLPIDEGPVTFTLPYIAKIPTQTDPSKIINKLQFITIQYFPPADNIPTGAEVLKAVDEWLDTNATIKVNNIVAVPSTIQVNSGILYSLAATLDEGQALSTGNSNLATTLVTTKFNAIYIYGGVELQVPKKNSFKLGIIFNNTALIDKVLDPNAPITPQPTDSQKGDDGDLNGNTNDPNTTQTDPAETFASALQAMLIAARSTIQTAMITDNSRGVYEVPLLDLTKAMFKGSMLQDVLTTRVDSQTNSFNITQYALKGYNSNLLANPSIFNSIPNVDFNKLCTGYGAKYKGRTDGGNIYYPTYIKLGYLLSFLNSMCLIYDSTGDTDKHPYVYLDFNPETNLCLTNPQHLTVDPYVCLIPFQGSASNYLKIFPKEIAQKLQKDDKITKLGPKTNGLSGYLPSFKGANSYQGKTMEILVNIDFLIDTLKQYQTNDPTHAVYLKGYLDAIVTAINKATGNVNLFRVSYRDDSNTVIIRDDQFVPPYEGDAYSLYKDNGQQTDYGVRQGYSVPRYGQIPVFGKYSLVRAMQLETNITTNLSKEIAISGQSYTGSVNSTDHSSYSYLNANFYDAYKRNISNTPVISSANSNQQNQVISQQTSNKQPNKANKVIDHDLDQAIQFNNHILEVYLNAEVSKDKVPFATNYYIERMSGVKSFDTVTSAAPFIPANLSITVDGISGIVMQNAFTIPEQMLPQSLRGVGNVTKVGFVVVGLSHTIENNEWLTKIRGQMIRLRDNISYTAIAGVSQIEFGAPSTAQTGPASLASATSELQLLWEKFKAAGFNQAAAAGAAGTIYAESGLNYRAWIKGATQLGSGATTTTAGSALGQPLDRQPSATFTRPTYQGKRITAYGIAQWTSDRLDQYVGFASIKGDSLATQLDFTLVEVKTRSILNSRLKNIPNTEAGAVQASLDWLDYFEYSDPSRSITNVNERNKRAAYAKGAYEIIKNFS